MLEGIDQGAPWKLRVQANRVGRHFILSFELVFQPLEHRFPNIGSLGFLELQRKGLNTFKDCTIENSFICQVLIQFHLLVVSLFRTVFMPLSCCWPSLRNPDCLNCIECYDIQKSSLVQSRQVLWMLLLITVVGVSAIKSFVD